MTVYVVDTFQRANNASSWGSAPTGGAYTKAEGTDTSAISSNVATLTGTTTVTSMIPESAGTSADGEILLLTETTGTAASIGAVIRATAGNTYYTVHLSSGSFRVQKENAGTLSAVGTGTTFTQTASTWYFIRARIQGSTIQGKIWLATAAEPVAWQQTQTDTTITAAGWFGIRSSHAGSTSTVDSYQFFSAQNLTFDFSNGGDQCTCSDSLSFSTSSNTVTNTWTADDVGLTPTDSIKETLINFATDSVTILDADQAPGADFTLVLRPTDSVTVTETYLDTFAFLPIDDISLNAVLTGPADTFAGRTLSGQWGTASNGVDVWQFNDATQSVGSGEGQVLNAAYLTNILGTQHFTDVEVVARFTLGQAGDFFAIDVRDTIQ